MHSDLPYQSDQSEFLCFLSPQPTQKLSDTGMAPRVIRKWTIEQNQRYLQFLELHKESMGGSSSRRQHKIFKIMSIFMDCTKDAEQCRGHHKKMFEKYGSVDMILKGLSLRNQDLREKRQIRQMKKTLSKKKKSETYETSENNQEDDNAQAMEEVNMMRKQESSLVTMKREQELNQWADIFSF